MPELPMKAGRVAESIANGHAYEKHARQGKGFSKVGSRDDFAEVIERIIRNPSASKRLPRARQAFGDDATRAVVIVDPGNPDFGTAFTPAGGKAYFNNLIVEETR